VIITVASGKGGTGKTMVATNLALSIEGSQYIDCDVEEPNGNLFLHAEIETRREAGIPMPVIDEERCTLCGDCAEACEFNALAASKERVLLFSDLCHGCGVCSYVCPEPGVITERLRRLGEIEMGRVQRTKGGTNGRANGSEIAYTGAHLDVGALLVTPLIKEVKRTADPERTVILDAPPGTSCPVVETLRGSDYCLLVTEPTPFGLNDLQLAVGVVRELGIRFGVILNQSDSGDDQVMDYCRQEGIPVLLEIPFSRDLAVAYSKGVAIIEQDASYLERFQHLCQAIQAEVGG
jgi:MinD superfamily P-loop ATPase